MYNIVSVNVYNSHKKLKCRPRSRFMTYYSIQVQFNILVYGCTFDFYKRDLYL